MAPCQNHGASSTFSDETSNFQLKREKITHLTVA